MARPSKYSPERVKRITDALASGNTRRAACQYGHIDEETFARWLKTHMDFADQIKSAESQAEVAHVANIAKAARDGTWQASAWWLERRHYADWGRKDHMQADITSGGERLKFTLNIGNAGDRDQPD